MSTAIQKRSRGVSVNRPSRSSAAANATEWTSRSSLPSHASRDFAEDALDVLVGADVAGRHELRADRRGELAHVALDPLALKGEGELRPLVRQAPARSPRRSSACSRPPGSARASRRIVTTRRSYGYSAVRAPPRRISRTRRGAHRHVGCCGCFSADRAARRRDPDPPRSRREDHDSGRSSQGPDHRHPDAGRPAARRLLPHTRRQQRHAQAERARAAAPRRTSPSCSARSGPRRRR